MVSTPAGSPYTAAPRAELGLVGTTGSLGLVGQESKTWSFHDPHPETAQRQHSSEPQQH